ncbi:c-type heme family protein [Mangrovimonas xylaniphaga]|uniref:c-type heme family protein n=1 Tax=Mangrovimonas xylaniphaga TaxID=1645915 RepID=UPI0006B49ECC|nr:DUF3365 domain-containing protein [Mangrovimonas xylaniphaga]
MKISNISKTLVLGLSLALVSCAETAKTKTIAQEAPISKEAFEEAHSIVTQNCVTCHAPAGNPTTRIAPPLIAVKDHYLKPDMTEAEFVQSVASFLNTPKIENSQMPRAVERFGLMPKLGYSQAQLEAVATYIYRAKLDQPDWFATHHQQREADLMKHSETGTQDYLKKGMSIALSTKAVLGKNLLTAIQTKGTAGALEFCNERAIVLTDSMSTELHAIVKRVSDKNRNPNNLANAKELDYIAVAKQDIAATGEASPKMVEDNGKLIGYYPIMTNQMCLQCHGTPNKDITPETIMTLKEKYPQDLATGYGIDELRGIWVIEMDKPQ